MKNYFFAALAVCALLSSCKKKDKRATCENTIAALAGKYKLTSVKVADRDVFNTLYPMSCEHDDIYFLNADKTVEYLDAGTACNGSPESRTGTWDIVNNELLIDIPIDEYYYYKGPVTNTCNGFEIIYPNEETDLRIGDIKLTFTKQ